MKKEHIFIIIVILIIGGITGAIIVSNKKSANMAAAEMASPLGSALSKTAQCLKDSGAQFFGASWCSHCANQKAVFKKSMKLLPYNECATGGAGSPQTQICIDNEIKSYPTWKFANGETVTGEISPAELAVKVNCELTEDEKSALAAQKLEIDAENAR
jgi:hypothetical protein